MQFYTKKDFGELISDTFTFLKENWKNYFKNYFVINGLLLILLIITVVFGFREIFSQMFSSNISGQAYHFEEYFLENQVMLIFISILIILLFIALMIISYSYPVLYMKRFSETGDKDIKADSILADIRSNLGRYIKLFLGLSFIVFPASMIIISISYILLIVIIGFFLLLIIIPVNANIINFLVFDYLHTDKSFFACLKYAINSQFSYSDKSAKAPFWKYWASTSVVYFIIQIVTTIFSILPVILFFALTMMAVPGSEDDIGRTSLSNFQIIVATVIYTLSITATFIFLNILYINSGFMYYDSRIDLHRGVNLSEIDTIGENEN